MKQLKFLFLIICMILMFPGAIVLAKSSFDESEYLRDEMYIEKPSYTFYVGEKSTLKLNSDYEDETRWFSTNKKIVSVDQNGNVIAKKKGTAYIYTYANFEDIDFSDDDNYYYYCDEIDSGELIGIYSYCKITVKKAPSYAAVRKEMKSLATGKDYTFKEIKKGEKCRLYGLYVNDMDTSKVEKEGYGMAWGYCPYIELSKKGNGSVLKLYCAGVLKESALYSIDDIDCDVIKFSTTNKKQMVSFTFDKREITPKYKNGIYSCESDGKIVLQSSTGVKEDTKDKMKKLKSILNTNKAIVRLKDSKGGASGYFQIDKRCTGNFLGVIKKYNKLVKKYS